MPTYTTYSCSRCHQQIYPETTKGNKCPRCGAIVHGLVEARARERLSMGIVFTIMFVVCFFFFSLGILSTFGVLPNQNAEGTSVVLVLFGSFSLFLGAIAYRCFKGEKGRPAPYVRESEASSPGRRATGAHGSKKALMKPSWSSSILLGQEGFTSPPSYAVFCMSEHKQLM